MCELAIAEFPDYFLLRFLFSPYKRLYSSKGTSPDKCRVYSTVLNRFDQMATTCVRNVVSKFQERGLIMIIENVQNQKSVTVLFPAE